MDTGTRVEPAAMPQAGALPPAEKILCCPRCKGKLQWGDTSVRCPACSKEYGFRDGLTPVYRLYTDEKAGESGRDPGQEWDQEKFEQGYREIGYHESSAEFEKQIGIPEEIGRFLFERVKGRMLEWVDPGPDHCILDVGCGAGYFLNLSHQRYRSRSLAARPVGVEISMNQLSYMVRRMSKEGITNAIAVQGNGEFLPFADESFDLITCSEVLEHIRNPVRALREMRRILKPGGKLLLSTPSETAIQGWERLIAPLAWVVKKVTQYEPRPVTVSGDSYDVPWRRKEFAGAIREAGLTILDFECNAIIPHYYCKFLPKRLIRPAVAVFAFGDRYLKPVLRPLAMHFVVRAAK